MDLQRCLKSLECIQTVSEILVVARTDDHATKNCVAAHEDSRIRLVEVSPPGQIAALNRALSHARGEVILFIDDDTVIAPESIEFVLDACAKPGIGGAGVRDHIHGSDFLSQQPLTRQVGVVQYHGRTIGNHHRGMGDIREVDILKGAFMAFRREAIKGLEFDTRLLGTGAQVHNDLSMCLAVRRRGWKLVYNPNITIEHFLAPRFDEDQRAQFNAAAAYNAVHNHCLTLLEYLPFHRKLIYLLWGLLIGTRGEFGLVQVIRHLPAQGTIAVRRGWAAWKGRLAGVRTYLKSRNAHSRRSSDGVDRDLEAKA